VPATWDAHLRFHATWPARVVAETEAIRERRPALVLSDVSYLAIEAGARAEVPAIALASLTWDGILAGLGGRPGPEAESVLGTIRAAYARATLVIRPTPGLPLPANLTVADVGPIAETPAADRPRLRANLGAAPGERVVLVGFGGIPLASLPLPRLAGLAGYRFVVDGPVGSPDGGRIHPVASASLPFRALLASCDVVVTKPGYGIVVEAVAAATPVVYVRRGNFADEPELVAYAHRHGRAAELLAEDLHAGRWRAALEAASTAPHPRAAAPALTGADEAARAIVCHLAGEAPGQAV
jgi:UDP:flavonoid glycosyltransferase YjiC (YdhE family)